MKLKIVSSDNALAFEVGAKLEAASCNVSLDSAATGFSKKLNEPTWLEQGIVAFVSDVPPIIRHNILWLLRQRGISPRHASGGVSDNEIGLGPLRSAEFASERVALERWKSFRSAWVRSCVCC